MLHFENYSKEELFEIAKQLRPQDRFSPSAVDQLNRACEIIASDPRLYANARGVRNVLDKASELRDTRIMDDDVPDDKLDLFEGVDIAMP